LKLPADFYFSLGRSAFSLRVVGMQSSIALAKMKWIFQDALEENIMTLKLPAPKPALPQKHPQRREKKFAV
jgi:hypothetical protein